MPMKIRPSSRRSSQGAHAVARRALLAAARVSVWAALGVAPGCGSADAGSGLGLSGGACDGGAVCNLGGAAAGGASSGGGPSGGTASVLCGNGKLDPGEACDGNLFGAATCQSATMNARPLGVLACDRCMPVTSGCTSTRDGGGAGGAFGAGGAAGLGGTAGVGGAPTTTPPASGAVWSTCRFHFGMDYGASSRSAPTEVDFVTSWAGSSESFNMQGMFRDCAPGGRLAGRVPVVYAYIIAFTARRDLGLKDCNVGVPNLCQSGATYIRQHKDDRILPQYRKYAQGIADTYGTALPVVWLMEPDYYQYASGGKDPQQLTFAEAGSIMGEIVAAVRTILPNAAFSLDISPWIPNPTAWYGAFDMKAFRLINTSGGQTNAGGAQIRQSNQMTWKQIHDLTGKPIMADTGYGVAGGSTGHDATWDSVSNLNARIADGVLSVSQANPKADWSTTIAAIRPQLATPASCP
jgi:hypothetical protein